MGAILGAAIGLAITSNGIPGDVYPRVGPIDSHKSEELYAELLAKLGPVVLKQTIVTPGTANPTIETFVIDLRNRYTKTLTVALPLSETGPRERRDQKLVAGYLRNSHGSFIFDPMNGKWRPDPFLKNRQGDAKNLDGASWNLAHVLIDTMSYKMRTRDAYEKASIEALHEGDDRQAREFAEECRKIPIPYGDYSEIDEGYEIPKWTQFKIGANNLVLEANKHEMNSEGRIVEQVRNEIISKYSFDVAAEDVGPPQDFITSTKVNAGETETKVIGLELAEFHGVVLVGKVYVNSPAAKAGALNGDKVLSINGSTWPLKIDEAKRLIEKSENPILTVSRAGEHLTFSLKKVPLKELMNSNGVVQFVDPFYGK